MQCSVKKYVQFIGADITEHLHDRFEIAHQLTQKMVHSSGLWLSQYYHSQTSVVIHTINTTALNNNYYGIVWEKYVEWNSVDCVRMSMYSQT